MIPGMGQLARDEELINEKELKRIEAMISSMTIKERRNPDIIKGRRRERIAKGSGTNLAEVNALIKQFQQMQRQMKKFAGMSGKNGGQMDPRDIMKMLR